MNVSVTSNLTNNVPETLNIFYSGFPFDQLQMKMQLVVVVVLDDNPLARPS